MNDLGEVEPELEKQVLSPQSSQYQDGELAQHLLDTLPPPEPKGLEEFVEGLGRVKPHLAPFPEKMSEEAVCEGLFPPPIPSARGSDAVFRASCVRASSR